MAQWDKNDSDTAEVPNQTTQGKRQHGLDQLVDGPDYKIKVHEFEPQKSAKDPFPYVEVISYMEKRRRLEQITRSQQPGSKIIVLCATKKICDQIARTLADQFGAAAIHGDKYQSERDSILSQIRTGRSPVLVATDVAAHGLDVKDISEGILSDLPTQKTSKSRRSVVFDPEQEIAIRELYEKSRRKRISAFSKEQEVEIKELFGRFKDQKKCSQLIADALKSDSTYTARQISRKLRQLGLLASRTKKSSASQNNPSGDIEGDETEDISDGETLLSIKERPFIHFNANETIACRLSTNEIQFFDVKDFSKGWAYKLRLPGVAAIELSKPGSHIAVCLVQL